ncbi:MAG: beta-L-arabinofuranosidase domain-containing protein, partial [Limisphaerales bacterium]
MWGHYHCMLGLLMWHEQTGNTNALSAVTRAADLVCNTYLDTGKRAIDAGSDEMNLSIIHALGWVYRVTGAERYLRMMREIEKDWERGGDYLRTGLAGTEFFQTPRPRWESLHNIQGLVELYRITGDQKYLDAFAHHWRSIARWDLRNSGGFSSGEQATGNPYGPTPIETCCAIAWMALSVDMLSLFGDAKTADLLELATFNAWAGAQHPSGRWCTYNTPMDGVREASAHSIVFQSRHGTPELNCCSVNGPRGWGMLSDWAFMRSADGFVVNWLAPGSAVFADAFTNFTAQPVANEGRTPFPVAPPRVLPEGGILDARQRVFWVSGNYPVTTNVEIRVELNHEEEFTLRIRIPEWSRTTRAWLNEKELPAPKAGTYLAIRRKWQSHWRAGDVVKLALEMRPRTVPGAREAVGKVSVYRGPILLAADQRFNSFDDVPTVAAAALDSLETEPQTKTNGLTTRLFEPMLVSEIRGADGSVIRLCDFASAGSTGTRYWSWLPVTNSAPPPIVTRTPRDSAIIPTGKVLFRWTKPATNSVQYLQVSSDED